MIGDVLIFKDVHHIIADRIIRVLKRKGDLAKKCIAVGGESGTGKSEIAHLIRVHLKENGYNVKIFHLDNYYRTNPIVRNDVRLKKGIDYVGDNEIMWGKLERHIHLFRKNGRATIPFIDLFTNQLDKLITSFENVDIVLVEGLYAMRTTADFRFFIDLTYHDTKGQRVARKKEKQTPFRNQVLEREHECIQALRQRATHFIKLKDLKADEPCRIIKNRKVASGTVSIKSSS